MSRSTRKNPITPVTTAASEAEDKKTWHRRYRRGENQRINHDSDAEPLSQSHYSDPWSMDKDGKQYRENASAEIFRK
jgi:hypothetical protein